MSLNDLILPPALLQQLYPEGLIPLQAAAAAGPPASVPAEALPQEAEALVKALPPLLGGGAGRLLIAVQDEAHPFLSENALSFLTSILGACRCSLADIQLLNTVRLEGWQIDTLLEKLAPERVLLFGVPLTGWPLPPTLPKYEIFRANGRSYILAPTLPAIEADKSEKARLWNILKLLFGL